MKKFVIIFFVFSISAFSQIPRDETEYRKFSEAAYNFDFVKAQEIAADLQKRFPISPLGYHAISQLDVWFYLGSRDENLLRKFFTNSDKTLELFDNADDENPYYLFRRGEEYSFRAIMYAFDFEKMSAFWAARNAISDFEDAIDVNPKFYDAYSGTAVFSYFLSFVPSFLKVGLSIIGINADVNTSIRNFKLAYEKGTFARTEAAFQLSKIYSDYYFDIDSSNYFLLPLIEKYPNNIFFKYQLGINYIRAKQFDKAEKVLLSVVKYDDENFSQIIAFSYFLLGEMKFHLNDFASAIKYFEKYSQFTRSINFMGYVNYKCGIAYYMLGEETKARECLLMAQYGNGDNWKDKLAYERSQKILSKGFSAFDKNLVYAKNNLRTGKYSGALKYCKKIENKTTEVKFICAESLIELKRLNKAKKVLNDLSVQIRNDESDEYLKLLYLKALNSFYLNNKSEAKKYLNELFSVDDKNNEFFAKARALKRKCN